MMRKLISHSLYLLALAGTFALLSAGLAACAAQSHAPTVTPTLTLAPTKTATPTSTPTPDIGLVGVERPSAAKDAAATATPQEDWSPPTVEQARSGKGGPFPADYGEVVEIMTAIVLEQVPGAVEAGAAWNNGLGDNFHSVFWARASDGSFLWRKGDNQAFGEYPMLWNEYQSALIAGQEFIKVPDSKDAVVGFTGPSAGGLGEKAALMKGPVTLADGSQGFGFLRYFDFQTGEWQFNPTILQAMLPEGYTVSRDEAGNWLALGDNQATLQFDLAKKVWVEMAVVLPEEVLAKIPPGKQYELAGDKIMIDGLAWAALDSSGEWVVMPQDGEFGLRVPADAQMMLDDDGQAVVFGAGARLFKWRPGLDDRAGEWQADMSEADIYKFSDWMYQLAEEQFGAPGSTLGRLNEDRFIVDSIIDVGWYPDEKEEGSGSVLTSAWLEGAVVVAGGDWPDGSMGFFSLVRKLDNGLLERVMVWGWGSPMGYERYNSIVGKYRVTEPGKAVWSPGKVGFSEWLEYVLELKGRNVALGFHNKDWQYKYACEHKTPHCGVSRWAWQLGDEAVDRIIAAFLQGEALERQVIVPSEWFDGTE